MPFTYDHSTLKIGLPVRSALHKQRSDGSVLGWVTTGESPLLYVFAFFALVDLAVICPRRAKRAPHDRRKHLPTLLYLYSYGIIFLQPALIRDYIDPHRSPLINSPNRNRSTPLTHSPSCP
ncbi:hypothetical protein BU23DRAFT_22442 [Bimuria novae-zelandiae CBS 107.79]|uniref:Uncharacterized protein n=1 Tax=Bimuria novae-zelandiae CBS 107.79 TaxID=1447943 RepID=A0A6A5URU0_9PLEO|nr:hypothetical protein BU23DRAFT_22442 [Bimuria novae-zelandiae CBS 107.79]